MREAALLVRGVGAAALLQEEGRPRGGRTLLLLVRRRRVSRNHFQVLLE